MAVYSANQLSGAAAEARALNFLLEHGCEFVSNNLRAKVGEIDLIVRDHNELVFVEVRARASTRFGGAAASVGVTKQLKVRRAAQLYLLRQFGQAAWPACRFDVVAIDANKLNWIKNAF